MDFLDNHLPASSCEMVFPVRPAADEPGTLRQQFEAIELYLANPWQERDHERRWRMARRTVLQHARREPLR